MSTDCDDGCEELATQRLRYFTGRHMTARDFADEQNYLQSRRHLHNRVLHGWGIVCGLHVRPHTSGSCNKDHVKVDCGLALDCCGREIPVPKSVVPPPIPWHERPAPIVFTSDPNADYNNADPDQQDGNSYPLLCLVYEETAAELVPVLYSEQACDPQRREYSRVDEGYRFQWRWVRLPELAAFHWKTRQGGCPTPRPGHPCVEDDCEGGEEKGRCCLDPQCPPHHCVPLALIRTHPGAVIEDHDIDIVGRPSLEPPPHTLTHICGINWPHGGVVSREWVEKNLRELRVRFDRRLKAQSSDGKACGPNGVNRCTFIVQYGGGGEDLDFVTSRKPPHVEHDCEAVFTIGRRDEDDYQPYTYLENQTVYITLKCDFILDCHGVAVDGNHIGGALPSGDGIRGGTFESWFRVVPDGGKPVQNTAEAEREQSS
jgi:hypothetical protein